MAPAEQRFYPNKSTLLIECGSFLFSFALFALIAVSPSVSLIVRPLAGFAAAVALAAVGTTFGFIMSKTPWVETDSEGLAVQHVLGRMQFVSWQEIVKFEVLRKYADFDSSGDYRFLKSQAARLVVHCRSELEGEEDYSFEIPQSRFDLPIDEVIKLLSAELEARREAVVSAKSAA